MKILDTTTINHILQNNLSPQGTYFMTPDVEDEMLTAELMWNKKVPSNVKNISQESFFDESEYLKNYFIMLNKHGGKSFFNMTGFGDISIISLVKTLVDAENKTSQQRLPLEGLSEEISIYSSDSGLTKRIKKEVGTSVKILLPTQL